MSNSIQGRRFLVIRTLFPEDAVNALGASLEALPQFVMQPRRVPLGTYRGLRFGIVIDPQYAPDIYL